MNNLLHAFSEYPVLIAVAVFLAISLLLAVFLGALMQRARVSLKPLVFFFGFIAIIAVPQAVVHLLDAFVHMRQIRAAASEKETTTPTAVDAPGPSRLQPVSWEIVFGPNADPSLIADAKRGLDYIVGDALEAKISFNAYGESALAARFENPEAAAAALNRYGSFFQFARVTGSDVGGWTARRFNGQGEWNHVVAAGNELYAWSGQTKESVESNRIRALGPLPRESGSARLGPSSASSGPSKTQVSTRLSSNWRAMTAFLIINLSLAVFWFFKGSAWSVRQPPQPGARPEAATLLRDRLLAVNQQNVPMQVVASPDANELEITWRYADAQWFDLMRAHRTRKTHKLVLALDEHSHKVRVREYWSAFDASAGPGSLHLNWTAARGMQFFQFEHRRVFGVQLDASGGPTGELSKAYTFNLQELKQPIIETVTASGWTWQPVMWNAPNSLRWLTE
jgi:hypothetical protein